MLKSFIISSFLAFGLQTIYAEISSNKLIFQKDSFSLETKQILTSDGLAEVTYRAYRHIPYVANPVDTDYQSLNIFVPVAINQQQIDATAAPLIFANGVGGYMPVNNALRHDPGNENGTSREDLALAAGMIVVDPGCRGRSNQTTEGIYYGKAPAGIVDLKAAIRFLRSDDLIPGDKNKIISVGCSAGGAMSALLGSSGNSVLYEPWLTAIGAADEPDHVFAAACYSPILDLEHADMAYEWEFGNTARNNEKVNQELSAELKQLFTIYQASLNLAGKDNFGLLTADNLGNYMARFYLNPAATLYLLNLPEAARTSYLTDKEWMNWNGTKTDFTLTDYTTHYVGRYKGLPAFDAFDLKTGENALFGNDTTAAVHFTNFSLRQSASDIQAEITPEIKHLVNLMNPMFFILNDNKDCAPNWWIRHGTTESGISRAAMLNLATSLENRNKQVDAKLFWEAMHCVDTDPEGFIEWIKTICDYPEPVNQIINTTEKK